MIHKIQVVTKVSDPPVISEADLAQIEHVSRELYKAFQARTAGMEIIRPLYLK